MALIMLVVLSVGLSYVLLSDMQQYEALPAWFTELPQITPIPGEELEPAELMAAVLKPERMVKHQILRHDLFALTDNVYARSVWSAISTSLVGDYTLTAVPLAEWIALTKQNSFEFMFAGSYNLNLIIPGVEASTIEIDRIILTADANPQLMVRSVLRDTVYAVEFTEAVFAQLDIATITAEDDDAGWQVYDAGANDEIMDGVYLPLNFIDRYGRYFPEVLITANTYSSDDWLGLFFAEPSLARQVALSNNQYHYTFGQILLSLAYSEAPHLEYSYTPLPGDNTEDRTMEAALQEGTVFIAQHNPENWPTFKNSIRLTSFGSSEATEGKYQLTYETYVTSLPYSVPIISTDPAFTVVFDQGVVTKCQRQIWEFGRLNYLPKISIDAPEAIERLSQDKWKTDMETNPYANFAISAFQAYLSDDYRISDVQLIYFTEQGLDSKQFVSPHWRIVLGNGAGDLQYFLINAMTGYVPASYFADPQ